MAIVQIVTLAQHEALHFGLALLVGLAAYWLTWIISSAIWIMAHPGSRGNMSSAVAYGTTVTGLLLGLALALLSHLWLDGLSIWLTTPLGPHMVIIR